MPLRRMVRCCCFVALLAAVAGLSFRARAEQGEKQPARLQVRMPAADAVLELDGVKLKTEGTDRTFQTPPLPTDRTFSYTLKATWTEKGAEKSREIKVSVQGGKKVDVDFT